MAFLSLTNENDVVFTVNFDTVRYYTESFISGVSYTTILFSDADTGLLAVKESKDYIDAALRDSAIIVN